MGDFRDVRRKVVSWREYVPPPTYYATLECGHEIPEEGYEWDGTGMPLDVKQDIETRGEVVCVHCTREEHELIAAEARVRELKARRKNPTPR